MDISKKQDVTHQDDKDIFDRMRSGDPFQLNDKVLTAIYHGDSVLITKLDFIKFLLILGF